MEGIDLELKLAERELLDKLAVLLDSLTLLGLAKRSQKCSVLSSCEFRLSASARSSEFWGEVVEYLCFLFKALGDGVDLKHELWDGKDLRFLFGNKWLTNLGDLGLLNFPIDAKPATSKAEMAARVEVLAEVSTYIKALICWLNVNACSGLMGALPCLDKLDKISRFLRKSDWQPTKITGVDGATARISGHQWFKALKRDEGSVIL